MEALLASLNKAQKDAVTSPANVVQVLAPPGSGKTKTLTARVAYLVQQCGFQPWNIIVCTFTVKAARAMRDRIKDLLGNGLEKRLILGTFHSVARRFLATYGHLIGLPKNFGVADTTDSKAAVKRAIKQHNLTIDPGRASSRISSNKSKGISAEQFAFTVKTKADEQEFSIVYNQYEATLAEQNLLDYDDLLLRCAQLLREHPECVSNIQAVLIDEFQDTNEVQFDLMGLLARQRKTVTIVGDPDQSIYGWRNAEIKNLDRMRRQYPDTVVIFLEENYRSSGAILASAQAVTEQDSARPNKRLQATHNYGEQPVLRRLPTAAAEAKWIVSEIKRAKALSGQMLDYDDFAVLLRSAALSRHIEGELGNEGVPYRMVGGKKFYDRAEIRLILDYLRVINQPEHNDALLRILNVPPRNIGEVTVKNLLDEAQQVQTPIWKLVLGVARGQSRPNIKVSAQAQKGLTEFVNVVLSSQKKLAEDTAQPFSPSDLVEHLLRRLDLEKYLKKKYPEDHESRWANVEELKAQTADLSSAIARGEDLLEEEKLPEVDGIEQRGLSQTEDLLSVFLANIALSSEVEKKQDDGVERSACVTISTVHAAKGLEWPVVFIPACYEGSIPHSRAEDNDEERRLLYVGMTRAQAILYLSCPVKNSGSQETDLSSFVTQQGVEQYFTVQGPTLAYYAISQLSQTLRRECPTFATITNGREACKDCEDVFWPLDGTFPPEELARWDHGSGHPLGGALAARGFRRNGSMEAQAVQPVHSGFVSAASVSMNEVEGFTIRATKAKSASSRMADLDRLQEELASRKLDQASREAEGVKSRGKKAPKVATGAASVASYFTKTLIPSQTTKVDSTLGKTTAKSACSNATSTSLSSARYLQTITNGARPSLMPSSNGPGQVPALSTYKPKTTPSFTRPGSFSARHDHISAIAHPLVEGSPPRSPDSKRLKTDSDIGDLSSIEIKPVSTYHTTSMEQLGLQKAGAIAGNGRRTLGMGRTFKPWSARSHR